MDAAAAANARRFLAGGVAGDAVSGDGDSAGVYAGGGRDMAEGPIASAPPAEPETEAETAARLMRELWRACDDAGVALGHGVKWLNQADRPPPALTAPFTDGLKHYGNPPSAPLDLWAVCRGISQVMRAAEAVCAHYASRGVARMDIRPETQGRL